MFSSPQAFISPFTNLPTDRAGALKVKASAQSFGRARKAVVMTSIRFGARRRLAATFLSVVLLAAGALPQTSATQRKRAASRRTAAAHTTRTPAQQTQPVRVPQL